MAQQQVQAGQTASGIAASLGMTPAQFLALNPNFAATGHPNDYQGLTGAIQVGQTYNTAPVQPPTGTGTGAGATGGATDTSTPVGDVFTPFSVDITEEDPFLKQYGEQNKTLAEGNIDEGATRASVLSRFQDQINATNQIYDRELAKARARGLQDTGSGTAILARRGLAGSARGMGIESNISNANADREKSVEAERQAALSAIYTQANSDATAELARQREAKDKGASAYLDYLKTKEERINGAIGNIASALIAQGVKDISQVDPNKITEIISNLQRAYGSTNITADKIINAFTTAKTAREKEEMALEKERLELNPQFDISEGQDRYGYNPKTGKYELIASKAKTYAPKAATGGGVGGSGGGGAFGSDLDAIIGNTLATISTKFGQEQFQAQIGRARNDADKIATVASVVLKGAPAQVKSDFGNQAIAVSNIDKAIKLIEDGAKTGFIKNGVQYTFNVFGKDFDPKLAAINSYITSAIQPYRSSITGAAWGDQEDAEYAQLFGSTKYSPTELKDRLIRIKDIMKNKSVVGLNAYVNPLDTYANPFLPAGTAPATTTPPPATNNDDPLGLFD